MAGRPRHIDRAGDLRDLCAEIAERGSFAVDMEFESERTYFPKLQLIQVAAGDDVALIDPLELDDLAPFWSLITDPGVTKITHAGRQDADIMYNECGEAPAALVDTQIAAALLGMGEQIGYASPSGCGRPSASPTGASAPSPPSRSSTRWTT
jgi:ribonuclease D